MKLHLLLPCVLFLSIPILAQGSEFHLDKEHDLAPHGTIELYSHDANVGSERNTVHLVVDRKVETKGISRKEQGFEIGVESNDGNLKVEESKGDQ